MRKAALRLLVTVVPRTVADLLLIISDLLGPASGFSLFSPRGLQWISSKIGSTELAEFVLNRTRKYMLGWSEEMVSMSAIYPPRFEQRFRQKLPQMLQSTVRSSPCVWKRISKLTVIIETSSDL